MSETDDRAVRTGKGGRRVGAAIGLVGVGLAAGAVLASTLSANAATDTTAPSASPSASASAAPDQDGDRGSKGGTRDESRSQRPDETLLTGDTKAKVTAAALAKYPGATIQRVETDSDGVYEAHLTTADGKRVTVEVGKDFAVTGEESHK